MPVLAAGETRPEDEIRIMELIDEHGLTRLGLENDYNIAYLYYHTADYSRAIRLYRRSRRRFEELGDERHRLVVDRVVLLAAMAHLHDRHA